MRDICIFSPDFNKEEREQIETLQYQIWDSLVKQFKPRSYLNGGEAFIKHSIKVIKNDCIEVLDTSTNPYLPINNRYLLKLILENIAKDDKEEIE